MATWSFLYNSPSSLALLHGVEKWNATLRGEVIRVLKVV